VESGAGLFGAVYKAGVVEDLEFTDLELLAGFIYEFPQSVLSDVL
jgi:hypothetical protein